MHEPIARRWVEALRSGEYGQTTHRLRDGEPGALGNGFCCLGVLCDLYAKEHPEAAWQPAVEIDDSDDEEGPFNKCWFAPFAEATDQFLAGPKAGADSVLPEAVMKWANFASPTGTALLTEAACDAIDELCEKHNFDRDTVDESSIAVANDAGATFTELADFIEQHWNAM